MTVKSGGLCDPLFLLHRFLFFTFVTFSLFFSLFNLAQPRVFCRLVNLVEGSEAPRKKRKGGGGGGGRGGRGHYSGETYILGVSDGRVLGCVRFYRLRLVVLLFCTEHVFGGYNFFSGCGACGLGTYFSWVTPTSLSPYSISQGSSCHIPRRLVV